MSLIHSFCWPTFHENLPEIVRENVMFPMSMLRVHLDKKQIKQNDQKINQLALVR